MKQYEEWKHLKQEIDINNPYSAKYVYDNGDTFYVEPVFYLKLEGFKQFRNEDFSKIIDEMEKLVHKNHIVVFVGEDEFEITHVEGAIYLTVQDVANPLCIFVEDKSRGSDYGD